MTVNMFSRTGKKGIIEDYLNEKSISYIARHRGCSETTVRRVLKEFEVLKPSKVIKGTETETAKIMAICYRHKIDSQRLEALINEPSLTPDNVVKFLRNSNQRQLAIILVAAGLATQLPTFPIPKDAQMRLIE